MVIDLFQTDTADYADIVLPAASFLEFDDLLVPYFHLCLSAQAKVMEPPGEALPNQEIFRRLAASMGYEEPALYESDRAIIDRALAGSHLGIGFEDLKAKGSIAASEEPLIAFADRQVPDTLGQDRDRLGTGGSKGSAAAAPAMGRPAAGVRPIASAVAGGPLADERQLWQRPRGARAPGPSQHRPQPRRCEGAWPCRRSRGGGG